MEDWYSKLNDRIMESERSRRMGEKAARSDYINGNRSGILGEAYVINRVTAPNQTLYDIAYKDRMFEMRWWDDVNKRRFPELK